MPIPSRPSTAHSMPRRRFLATATGLALAALAPSAWALAKGLTPLETPMPAPALRLQNLEGKTIDLAQYRGRVVLVNFWATWCPPCRKEFPSLGRVRKLFKPEEFEVLAVNVDEDRATALAFAGSPGFPILLDTNSKATMTWPIKGLPTSFLIDPQGRLAYSLAGEQEFDDPEVVDAIRGLLQP